MSALCSCNGLANSIAETPLSAHPLIGRGYPERGWIQNREPGPYRIYAVYRCNGCSTGGRSGVALSSLAAADRFTGCSSLSQALILRARIAR